MVCSLRTFLLFLLVKKWLQKHQFQYSMPYVSELNLGSCDFMLLLFFIEICIHVVMCGRTYARRARDVRRAAERAERAKQALREISSRE
jgi:uncharacterized membrane protein